MARRIVKTHAALHVWHGGGRLPGRARRRPAGVMRLQLPPGVAAPAGCDQQALAELGDDGIESPVVADEPEPPERGEEARGIAEALGGVARAQVGRLDVARSRSLDGDE